MVDGDAFVLPLPDGEVRVRPTDGRWRVQSTTLGILSTYGDATNGVELHTLVANASGRRLAVDQPPARGRLAADTPATNYRTISRLIDSAKIVAVFDPYIDNSALEQLVHIVSFGNGSFAADVCLLGSTAKTSSKPGTPARFSNAGVTVWAAQLGIRAEGRYLPKEDEHRRFLLLSGGRSLLLGPSINSIHKNEAVSVEDDREDRPFFEAKWGSANVLL